MEPAQFWNGLPEQNPGTLGAINPSVNRNRFLVSEELQQLILDANPGRVKFTASQRLNTQLVLDEFVLKKKKGPTMRQGCRVVNWKCTKAGCLFVAATWEGHLVAGGREHNRPAEPEVYAAKQARARLREGLEETGGSVAEAVDQVVGETPVNLNVEALKQAARRYTRKFKEGKKEGRALEFEQASRGKGDLCCVLEGCYSKSPGPQPLMPAVFFAAFQEVSPEGDEVMLCPSHGKDYDASQPLCLEERQLEGVGQEGVKVEIKEEPCEDF